MCAKLEEIFRNIKADSDPQELFKSAPQPQLTHEFTSFKYLTSRFKFGFTPWFSTPSKRQYFASIIVTVLFFAVYFLQFPLTGFTKDYSQFCFFGIKIATYLSIAIKLIFHKN